MIVLFAALALAAEPYEHTFTSGVKSLDLSASKGTLTVRNGGGAIVIRGTHEGDQSMCHLDTSEEHGPTATYKVNGNSTVPRECITNMEVTLPAGAGLHVKLSQGTLDVVIDGDLQGSVAKGDVTGSVKGAINLQVATGNVALAGLTQPAEIKVSEGNAALVYDQAPEGTILVTVSRGGVYVDLPDGTAVDARVPDGVVIPHPQKTSSPTRLMISKVQGEILVE